MYVVIISQLRRLDMPASLQQNISYCTTLIISMETSEISHLKLYMHFFAKMQLYMYGLKDTVVKLQHASQTLV